MPVMATRLAQTVMPGGVVSLEEIRPGVVHLSMHDAENRNTFTDALLLGLSKAFELISEEERFRAAVLSGHGTYFCTGGTRESLLRIHEGQTTFDGVEGNAAVYALPLDCPIPVVAAMQGHAIGGGLSLGLFCDHAVLAREAVYSASFMKFGFTPGFGSTYIFPEKLGLVLAQDFLLTARTFRGADLQERGIPYQVYPRDEVLTEAIAIASALAEKPRVSLVTLKSHLVRELRQRLPDIIHQEMDMHAVTFHQPEVRTRLMDLYGT